MAIQFKYVQYLRDNYQDSYQIRIRPDTNTLIIAGRQNISDEIDKGVYSPVVSSGSRKQSRSFSRIVRFGFSEGLPEGGLPNALLSLPWLRPEGWDNIFTGATGTYKGSPIIVVNKLEEKIV